MTAAKRSRVTSTVLSVLFAACLQQANAAQAQKLEDHLQERWFEIEVIVFERLDVLDANTGEALTQNTPLITP